ncbi:MAG TPA: AAA family ATPase [Methylomirabilota bacterium]|nr:AAA family ATPase [Methylomirabilota bacterium]
MRDRIHVLGASGSGTSTLASALAAAHGHRHLDTDDFFWLPSDPPFQHRWPLEERLAKLRAAVAETPRWVLAGSLCGWGDPLIPEFELVVFLLVPTEVRLARLRAREQARYGTAIAPGGSLHEASAEFLEWAARYDAGDLEMRSRARHEAWLAALPGPVLRLEGDRPVAEQLARVEASMGAPADGATTRVVGRYRITVGDGRSTEALVAAGQYGYAHSCLNSECFPARHFGGARVREIVLLELDRPLPSDGIIAAAARLGLERPTYEDALYFGVAHPEAQRERPIVFLHDPWFGFFGRRDVLCLWSNAGRRELGLEGYDEPWSPNHRFAFVRRDGVRS